MITRRPKAVFFPRMWPSKTPSSIAAHKDGKLAKTERYFNRGIIAEMRV